MCGIAGFCDFSKTSTKESLVQITDTLIHRGPNDGGYELIETNNATIGLGNRRLAIIDLSIAGKQPIYSKDKKYCIVLNGEIYNYVEIKNQLLNMNHIFNSNSDTEVVLNAYIQWGRECVNRFIGMFAFVIYDAAKQELVCCIDRLGIKPFYYYYDDNLFLFGSELKALLKHNSYKPQIDLNAVSLFFQYGYVPTPYCIYQKTNKLDAGTWLIIDLKTKQISKELYYDIFDKYRKTIKITEIDAKDQLVELFDSAFNYRMVSDVPVGVFLSGGYDSSLLSAILQKNNKINTFTIGFEEKKYDEAVHAKKIASFLGTNHIEEYCSINKAIEIISDLPYYYDEPFGDSSAIPTFLVSKIASKYVKVVLSADGGDELFGGYPNYKNILKFSGILNKIPKVIKQKFSNLLFFSGNLNNKNNLFYPSFQLLLSELLKTTSPMEMLKSFENPFTWNEVEKLFLSEVNENNTLYSKNSFTAIQSNEDLNKMLAIDYKGYLRDDILVKVDRATMANSIEGREPFLDHRILEFVATLPANLKQNNNIQKYLLKKISYDLIPFDLLNRPKQGFEIPINKWLKNELKPNFDYYLSKQRIESQGIFNYKVIDYYKKAFHNNHKIRGLSRRIWLLIIFQMWLDKWIYRV